MTQPLIPAEPPPMLARPEEPAPIEGTVAPAATGIPEGEPSALTEAFRAGQLTLQPGTRVGMRDPSTGKVLTVPAEEASKAVEMGGELLPESAVKRAELEAKYGGALGMAGAAGAGVARGVSVGLSDPALVALGGEGMRERLAAYQELHPVASVGGELVGAIAPAFIPGAGEAEGAGLLARGARALGAANEGVGMAARAGERLATRIIGREAETVAGRMAQQALTKGVEGAILGGIYGAGGEASRMALSEEHLGPPAEVASKLFSATAHGALLGGALGGALGAGAEGAKEALKAATVKAQPHLAAQAEESAFKSLNARKLFTNKAAEIPGGTRGIGRQMLKDGILEAGDDVEKIAGKVEAARAKAGEALDAKINQVAAEETVPLKSVLEKLEKRATDFDKKLGYEAAAGELRKTKERLAEMYLPRAEGALDEAGAKAAKAAAEGTRVPLLDLLQARRDFEKTVNFQTETVLAQGRQAAGRTLEDFVTESADALARKKGLQSWAAEYKEAKTVYRRYAVASEAVQDSLVRKEANAGFSLTDKIHSAHGLQTAALGVMTGHPMAAVAGLAGPASHWVRSKGSSTAAVWLDKLSQLGKVESVTSNVQRNIDKGLDGFFSGKGAGAGKSAAAGKADIQQWQRAIAAYKANPAGAAERLEQATAGVATHAPNVAKEYGSIARRAMQFLASKLPDPPRPRNAPPEGAFIHPIAGYGASTNKNLAPPKLDPMAEAKFARYVKGVDLEQVSADFARGQLSYEEVQAVREVHPEMFQRMQMKVKDTLTKHPEKLSLNQQLGLQLMFDMPVMWASTPDGIRTLQKAIAISNAEEAAKTEQMGQPSEGAPGGPPGGGGQGAAGDQASRMTMPASDMQLQRRG